MSKGDWIFLLICCIVATFLITGTNINRIIDEYWQNEAVSRGYGELKIDEDRVVYFTWKEPKPAEKP